MKAITPMSLGLLHKPYRYQKKDRLVIVGIGFFRLGGDAETFLPEQTGWPEVVKSMPQDQVLDMVMPKPHGEVLAVASAYSAQPVDEMKVRMQVGTVDKQLSVSGEREWFYGVIPLHGVTETQPFCVMPIDYGRAYGGPEHKGNPLGKAYTGKRFGYPLKGNRGAMPNVEYPDRSVSNHHRLSLPAGFGPLDVRWTPRCKKGGTYNKRWLEEDAPGLAQDIDWSIFNAAPGDQQLSGYFKGGESYRLEGMHPTKHILQGHLPDMRPRAFLQRESTVLAEEVNMVFDTVWFFPDTELGVALYRGEADIEQSDAGDISALLLAYEKNQDAPRSVEHYRNALSLRLGTAKEALIHMVNEAPLKPELDGAAKSRLEAEQKLAEEDYLERSQAVMDATMEEIASRGELPNDFKPPKATLPPFGVLPKAALARGEADLSDMFARIDTKVAQVKAEGEEKRAELDMKMKQLQETLGKPIAEKPQLDEDTDAAIARAHGESQAEMEKNMQDVLDSGAEISSAQRQAMEQMAEKIADLKCQGRRVAQKPEPQPLSPPTAEALGLEVRRLLALGETLAGRDLAGASLAGICLAGADLRKVMLERANLKGANLRGADLRGAVLTGALLQSACLDDVCLDDAGLNAVQAKDASFKRARGKKTMAFNASLVGADLSESQFDSLLSHKADLTGACMNKAQWTSPLLLELCAPDSSWCGASLDQAIFLRADLSRANFEDAQLKRAVLAEVQAPMIKLSRAVLENCFFFGADLSGGELTRVRANSCSWRKGKLAGINLSDGSFEQCDFGEANLEGARLQRCRLNRSILSKATLVDCDGKEAEFFQSQCRMTDFSAADMSKARFMQADLSEAKFVDTHIFETRHLPEKQSRQARQ